MKRLLYLLPLALLAWACTSSPKADYILKNGRIYTVNKDFAVAQAMAVKGQKIVAIGSDDEVLSAFRSDSIVDLEGQPVYPGLFDGHSHFYRYALGLRNANLVGTESYADVIQKLQAFRDAHPQQAWLLGRGWDQNDWKNQAFPTKDTLDQLFPNTPVALTRIDGHALLANQKALDLAGITPKTKMEGGLIQQKEGKLTGILLDNATELVYSKIPDLTRAQKAQLLDQAQHNCFALGLTSLADCGLEKSNIDIMDSLQKAGKLKMKVYAMANPTKENIDWLFTDGPYQTDYMHVASFKVYSDGALGSRGACLLQPYSDDPGNYGFLLQPVSYFDSLAKMFYQHNFQMNTHAIGDSANRVMLKTYARYLKGRNDRRWRIEHAQIVNPADLHYFNDYSIIPSVQPTHATSDMYWAAERLGEQRLKSGYAYKDLLKEEGKVVLGTDFPVEYINPFYTFHAAVARQDNNNYPPGGFQPENALSRENTLRGMTIWAAYGQFEEKEKGSLEAGKIADFVILDQDLMQVADSLMPKTKVLYTVSNGKIVYAQ